MSATDTTALTPEELAGKLDALDDETMCFDGEATYALIRDAAHVIRAQKLHTDRVDGKLVEQARQIEAQRAEIERLTKEVQELSAAHYDATEGISATLAEAALADLLRLTGQTDAAKAVAVVATMLAGADNGSYGSVVREYAEGKAALAANAAQAA